MSDERAPRDSHEDGPEDERLVGEAADKGLELEDKVDVHWQLSDFARSLRGAVRVLPPREALPREERIATAAVCVIRALQHQPPAHCPPGKLRIFVLLHNAYYRWLFKLVVLAHVVLTFFEPPPRLYGTTSRDLEDSGFLPHWATILANVAIVLFYNLHCALTVYVEGWAHVHRTSVGFLLGVVFLTNVDVLVGIATEGVHPFRFLRPLVFTFTSSQQTMLLKCSMYTLKPLVKTFVLLLISISFYSVLGLNMFGGAAAYDDESGPGTNAFGAACLLEAGERHPFDNFAHSWITMYVLATTDSHPEVLWPFYTCKCEFVSEEANMTFVWETTRRCTSRKYVALAFFVSFMAIVFFCLGNTILAVCYFWFERVMKRSVVTASLQQRFSLISAFYYLEHGGQISMDDFMACSLFMRKEAKGLPGTVDGDKLLFRYLDRDGDGGLSLPEFFHIVDLMSTHIRLHKSNNRFPWYAYWKNSKIRKVLWRITVANVFGITLIDIGMTIVVTVNGVLAALEDTRKDTQRDFAAITTWLFVGEVLVKVGAMGVQSYLIDIWNRFDLAVTIATLAAFVLEAVVTDSAFFGLVQCARLVRLVKVFALLQRAGRNVNPEKEDGFYAQLLNSLATTVPVCLDVLLLIFFYLYGLSILTLELFHNLKANSQLVGLSTGIINYAHDSRFQYDWADLDSSLLSMFIIIVGNDWADVMYNAQEADNSYGTFIYFVLVHFVGSFLLLNIIQSLFVFTFSTLMSSRDFRATMASQIREQLDRLHALGEGGFKEVRNAPKLELLLLNHEELDGMYKKWVRARKTGGVIELGGARLEIDPLSSFLFHKANGGGRSRKHTRSAKRGKVESVEHIERVQEFMLEELGVSPRQEAAGAVSRRDPLKDDEEEEENNNDQLPRRRTRSLSQARVDYKHRKSDEQAEGGKARSSSKARTSSKESESAAKEAKTPAEERTRKRSRHERRRRSKSAGEQAEAGAE